MPIGIPTCFSFELLSVDGTGDGGIGWGGQLRNDGTQELPDHATSLSFDPSKRICPLRIQGLIDERHYFENFHFDRHTVEALYSNL